MLLVRGGYASQMERYLGGEELRGVGFRGEQGKTP